MLYLGIDQHAKQLTVNLGDEAGDCLVRRQVSTRCERVRAFFTDVAARAKPEGGFVAIVEVCGFNDWLMKVLEEYGCREIVLIQPDNRSKKKTDRRDAAGLRELLWVNRERLLAGKTVHGLRRVVPATCVEAGDRQLTSLRQRLGAQRTRTINKVQRILQKHNLQHDCPTKGFHTKAARRWLESLPLGEIDRLEMDLLLAQWRLWDEQIAAVGAKIEQRQHVSRMASIIATMPGAGAYSSLAIASRIGSIDRFPRPGSLANYWGLTPSCRNSGEATGRLGSITKQGSSIVRFILGQMVLHVLRRDPWMKAWYAKIKRRRGSKVARVAVMRRMATIIWHMVKHNEAYVIGGTNSARQAA